MDTLQKVLEDAMIAFREYEAHHNNKLDEPGREQKARRNRQLAERIEYQMRRPELDGF